MGCVPSSIRPEDKVLNEELQIPWMNGTASGLLDTQAGEPIDEEVLTLTMHDKMVLKESWDIIRWDRDNFGIRVFNRLQTLNAASLDRMFQPRDIVSHTKRAKYKVRLTIIHGRMFGKLLEALAQNTMILEKVGAVILRNLGKKHTRIPGFSPEYFVYLIEAVTIEWRLCKKQRDYNHGGGINEDMVEKTWAKLFRYMQQTMLEGVMRWRIVGSDSVDIQIEKFNNGDFDEDHGIT